MQLRILKIHSAKIISMIPILMVFVISDVCTSADTNSMRGTIDGKKFEWTPELDAIISDIYQETKLKGGNHADKMKEEWDRRLPQFKGVKALNLRRRAQDLIHKRGEESRTRSVIWTSELKSDLMEMYIRTVTTGGRSLSFKLHEKFYGKHPNIPRLAPRILWERARISYEKLNPEGKGKLKMKGSLGTEYEEELLRVYREQPSNFKDQADRLYEKWVKLHPEHDYRSPRSIQSQMRRVARQREGEAESSFVKRHKWTRKNHADLLHIDRRLETSQVDNFSKLHEIWSKMNPELKYMSREHLRQRRKQLMYRHYEPTESEDEEARVKFDELLQQNDLGECMKDSKHVTERATRRRNVCKRKSEMDPAAEHLNVRNLRSHDSHPRQPYDSMSVHISDERSHHSSSDDEDSKYIARNSQAPYNSVHNYHHGESSNAASHQQTDLDPTSPSENPLELFFDHL